MDFSQVKQLFIPQGEVTKITNLEGITLWQKISRILKEWRGLSPLICTPTVADNFEEVKVYGNSVQNPIKSRNLLDKDNLINGYYSATGVLTSASQDTYKTYDKFPVKPNTNYILSSIAPTTLAIYWRVCFWDKDKNFISRDARVIHQQIKFNTGDNIAYVSISPEKEGWEYDLQLEEGDTATSFVPYIIDTPTPDTPIPVESVGDKTINLFDKANAPVGGYITSSGDWGSGTDTKHIEFLEIPQGVSYISRFTKDWISSSLNYATRIAFYDENKTHIKTETGFGNDATNVVSVRSGAKYIQCSIGTKDIEGTVIYWGNKAITDYVPYGYQIPVEVSGNLYKDTYLYAPTQCSFMSLKKGIYTMSVANDESPSNRKNWYVRLYKDGNVVTESGHLTSPQGTMNFSTASYNYYGLGANYNTGISFIIDDDYDVQVGKSGADRTVELMVNVGATPLPYQPYTEPTTTNIYLNEPLRKVGDYADTLNTVKSKNLFNKENSISGWWTSTTSFNTDSQYITVYTEVKPNTNYTFSGFTGDYYRITLHDNLDTCTQRRTQQVASGDFTVTTTANTKYIGFGCIVNANLDTTQLEEGETSTSYAPYNAGLVTVVRNVGSVDMDKLKWSYQVAQIRWLATVSNILSSSGRSYNLLLEEYQSKATSATIPYGYAFYSSKSLYCRNDSDIITPKGMCYYPLETPTTETYTIDSPINAIDNTTIIDIDTTIKPSEVYASQWIEQ